MGSSFGGHDAIGHQQRVSIAKAILFGFKHDYEVFIDEARAVSIAKAILFGFKPSYGDSLGQLAEFQSLRRFSLGSSCAWYGDINRYDFVSIAKAILFGFKHSGCRCER